MGAAVSYRSPFYGHDYNSIKPNQREMNHFKRMSQITKRNENQEIYDHVSPYSILRVSSENDVDNTIEKITAGKGPRTTRAQLLR